MPFPIHRDAARSGGINGKIAAWALTLVLCLPATRSHATEPFAQRVNRAIDEASHELLSEVEKKGWLQLGKHAKDYPMASMALTMTALLRSGIDPHNGTIVRGQEILFHLPLDPGSVPNPGIPGWPEPKWKPRCYDLALGILALEAPYIYRRAIVQGDHFQVRYSRLPVPPQVRERMDELTKRLVVMMKDGAWGYTSTERQDNSNTQFAVLALNAARRAGVKVSDDVWKKILFRLLRDQHKEGPEVELSLKFQGQTKGRGRHDTPPRKGRTGVRPGGKGSGAPEGRKVMARPWGYYMGGGDVRFSMVCACLSSLVMSRDALEGSKSLDRSVRSKIEDSILGGLAYVASHWDEYSKGNAAGEIGSLMYDLYSFEKFGEIEKLVLLNGKDWYRVGADKLLMTRKQRGGWARYFNTALALLFLNRATLDPSVRTVEVGAVYTGKNNRGNDDLVYVDFLHGLVSGKDALEICADVPNRHNVRCAEEVVKGYPTHRLPRLIPQLLRLYQRSSQTRRIVRDAFRTLVGTAHPKEAELVTLHDQWKRLYDVEMGDVKDDGEARTRIEAGLHADVTHWVAYEALRALEKRHFADLAPDALALFDHHDKEIASHTRNVLWGLTGIDLPYDPSAPAATRKEQAEAWRKAIEKWLRSRKK